MTRHLQAAAIIEKARCELAELQPDDINGYQVFECETVSTLDQLLDRFTRWMRYHEVQAAELGEIDAGEETREDAAVQERVSRATRKVRLRPRKDERIAKRVPDPGALASARKPKRFIVFVDDCTSNGGWEELKSCFDTLEDAVDFARDYGEDNNRWWHIVDVQTFEVVADRIPMDLADPWWRDPRDLTD
jgi:hypothetical protein